MAKEAGIEGFCYWHYWFAGRRLLDRVFKEVVESGKPDFPFCLCWANHSWYQKTWDPNKPNKLLIEQTYYYSFWMMCLSMAIYRHIAGLLDNEITVLLNVI